MTKQSNKKANKRNEKVQKGKIRKKSNGASRSVNRLGRHELLLLRPSVAPTNHTYAESHTAYTARFRKEISTLGGTFTGPLTTSSGFVAWFPGYHCANNTFGELAGQSLFSYARGAAYSAPLNDITYPYGSGSNNTTTAHSDPAHSFVYGPTCSTARTVAAEMVLRYTGQLQSLAGEYVVLTDVSADTLITELPSVDSLFALSNDVRRLSLGPMTVRYRPSTHTSTFRTSGARPDSDLAKPIISGDPTFSTSLIGPDTSGQKAVVIAWRDVVQPASNVATGLAVSLSKVVEWTPQAGSGLSGSVPGSPGPHFDAVTRKLDASVPGWESSQSEPSDAMRIAGVGQAMAHIGVGVPGVGGVSIGW